MNRIESQISQDHIASLYQQAAQARALEHLNWRHQLAKRLIALARRLETD